MTIDDDDDDDDDESTGSSTGTDATPMPSMENSTLRTFYLADGSAMLPVATSDPWLTDQVEYRRYRLRKRKSCAALGGSKRIDTARGRDRSTHALTLLRWLRTICHHHVSPPTQGCL
jgi:hypothetical protein